MRLAAALVVILWAMLATQPEPCPTTDDLSALARRAGALTPLIQSILAADDVQP